MKKYKLPSDDKLLTQEEVNNLPDGIEIIVLWRRGNEGFGRKYTLGSYYDIKYVLDSYTKKPNSKGPLDFVGKKQLMRTKVWLEEPDEEETK